MPSSMRYFILLTFMTVLSALTVSCSESKVSQCNKIINVANKAVSETKSITNAGPNQSIDLKATLRAADVMEKASQEMKTIRVSDETLRDYQSRFVQMYSGMSKATRTFITAYEKKDRASAENALSELKKVTAPEKQLVEGINNYCTGK